LYLPSYKQNSVTNVTAAWGGRLFWVQAGPQLYRTQKFIVIFFRMDSIHLTACICFEMWGIIVNNYRGSLIMK